MLEVWSLNKIQEESKNIKIKNSFLRNKEFGNTEKIKFIDNLFFNLPNKPILLLDVEKNLESLNKKDELFKLLYKNKKYKYLLLDGYKRIMCISDFLKNNIIITKENIQIEEIIYDTYLKTLSEVDGDFKKKILYLIELNIKIVTVNSYKELIDTIENFNL